MIKVKDKLKSFTLQKGSLIWHYFQSTIRAFGKNITVRKNISQGYIFNHPRKKTKCINQKQVLYGK